MLLSELEDVGVHVHRRDESEIFARRVARVTPSRSADNSQQVSFYINAEHAWERRFLETVPRQAAAFCTPDEESKPGHATGAQSHHS